MFSQYRAHRIFIICAFVFGLFGAAEAQTETRAITLSTNPLIWNPADRQETKTGKLIWAGGIEITSDDKDFGGWSGLVVSEDGTALLSVSDQGRWLSAMILYDERGRLSGLVEGRMAPMLGLDGETLEGKTLGDAESLALDGTPPGSIVGQAYVSFERAHRIWRYDLSKKGFQALPEQLLTQRHFGRLKSNAGIEALELLPPTSEDASPRILAITEDTLDPRGNIRAFVADGRAISRFAVKPHSPYMPTDAARLPNGDLLLLERRFSLLAGVGMQLRLIRESEIKEGNVADGEVLIDVGQRYSIDNMEGLAVRTAENGDLLVYMISDNNFNPLQRNLLLMFRLPMAHIAEDTED